MYCYETQQKIHRLTPSVPLVWRGVGMTMGHGKITRTRGMGIRPRRGGRIQIWEWRDEVPGHCSRFAR